MYKLEYLDYINGYWYDPDPCEFDTITDARRQIARDKPIIDGWRIIGVDGVIDEG